MPTPLKRIRELPAMSSASWVFSSLHLARPLDTGAVLGFLARLAPSTCWGARRLRCPRCGTFSVT
jgi:hypothetical protein